MNLLIVEDSPVIGTLVRKILERLGPHIQLVAALNGKQGIEEAKKERPSLVILDWMMPEYGGEYFLKEQCHIPEIANVPVFVHTGLKEEDLKNIIKNYPAVKSFIRKPIIPTKLFAKIKTFLDDNGPKPQG